MQHIWAGNMTVIVLTKCYFVNLEKHIIYNELYAHNRCYLCTYSSLDLFH